MIQRSDSIKDSLKIADLVIAVVRGGMPVDAVKKIGVEIDQQNGLYKLKSDNFDAPVTPTAMDVASGIVSHSLGNKC